jgi:hypothetical protein
MPALSSSAALLCLLCSLAGALRIVPSAPHHARHNTLPPSTTAPSVRLLTRALAQIHNDSSVVADTGDSAFSHYSGRGRRRLSSTNAVKLHFLVDLGTVGGFFVNSFEVSPKSARSSVSYLQFLQSSERVTGKACGRGYMGHDCTERVCPYGVSIYASLFADLDHAFVPGFSADQLAGAPVAYSGAQHTYVIVSLDCTTTL